MARPGYVEAKQVRDKEFYAVKEWEQRLADIDLLGVDGHSYSAQVKEVRRQDALAALQKHQQALEIAEAAFAVFADTSAPKIPNRKYFDTVISMQISVTHDMMEGITRACESQGIRRTELFRKAMEMYLSSLAD